MCARTAIMIRKTANTITYSSIRFVAYNSTRGSMIRKIFAILSLFSLLCGQNQLFSIPPLPTSVQYENQVIQKIDVEIVSSTNTEKDSAAVLARIKTKEGEFFSQTIFDNDLKVLVKDFDRVEPTLNTADGRIFLTLKVWPKPRIRAIRWDGFQRVRISDLQEELGIRSGAVFDRKTFNQAFHKIKAHYVKKGFFEAELNYNVTIDPLCNQADIDICIQEGRAGKIKDIVFVNFFPNEEKCLLDMIVTKKYIFLISMLTGDGTYSEDAIQFDEYTILNYLQNQGYADAKVTIQVCEANQDDRIIVYITADRGPLYRFGTLSFEGNTLFDDEKIQNRFTICEGKPYSPERIRQTVDNITTLYGIKGYIDTQVAFEPRLNCDDYTYSVNLKIEEGEQFRIGLIKLFGNCTTQSRVILHESLVYPGDVFNTLRMKATETRLMNIQYFKTVNVYPVKTEESCSLGENYRDIHIEVEETSTGQFGAFGGFSTTESIFGGFNISEKNFNICGIPYVWSRGLRSLRGAGEYAYFTATFGTKTTSYVFSWAKPHFMDTNWTIGFNLERSYNRYVSNDYDIKATGFRLYAIHRYNNYVRSGYHYRLRYSSVSFDDDDDDDDDDCDDDDDDCDDKKCDDDGDDCKKNKHCNVETHGLISAVGAFVGYDSTNSILRPTDGFKSRLDAEIAGLILGGARSFFSTSYLNSYFLSFPKYDCWGIWKFRADTRFIIPLASTSRNEIPLDERLFLGGEEMVRGYRPYRLGPKCNHNKDEPSGGLSLQLVSLEYARLLHPRVEGFVFFDSGHLSDQLWNFGRMSSAVGYGARIQIIDSIPQLTVGMGYPINPQNRSEVKRFFFAIGGSF